MRVVVVGAGFAGMAAAYALDRAGHEVIVLEARDRVGGRVWSRELPTGGVVEMGAEFILPDNAVVRRFAQRLGLRLFEKGCFYGDREPRGGIGVTRAELLAGYAAVRAATAGGVIGEGSIVDALGRLAMADGAREAIRARIEVSTAYPADDQAAHVLAESGVGVGDFPTWSVAGGNQGIALAIAAALGERVHLRAPVRRIGWSADVVTVATDAGEVTADAVVVAVPASVIGRITFDPPLPARTAAALAGVRYGVAAKLFLPLETPVGPSAVLSVPDRFWTFTQHAPGGGPLPVAGSFAGSPLALDRLAVADGPERWIERVAALRPDLAIRPADALLSTWSDDPWIGAAYSAHAMTSELDDVGLTTAVGPIHFAGEHTAGEWHALMDGALRTGLRAAAEIAGPVALEGMEDAIASEASPHADVHGDDHAADHPRPPAG